MYSCYYCLTNGIENIKKFTDDKTPICPKCGIDALTEGDVSFGNLLYKHIASFHLGSVTFKGQTLDVPITCGHRGCKGWDEWIMSLKSKNEEQWFNF